MNIANGNNTNNNSIHGSSNNDEDDHSNNIDNINRDGNNGDCKHPPLLVAEEWSPQSCA